MSQITKPIALDETLQDVVTAIQGITQGGMIVSTGNVGSATQPVYINGGMPTAIDAVDTVAEASRVKSSTELDALCALVVADHKTRFFRIQGTTGMDTTLSDLITYKNTVYPYGWGIISDSYSGGASNYDIVITYFGGPGYPDNSQSRIFIWKQNTSGTFHQNNVLVTNKDTDIQTGTPTNINSYLTATRTEVHKSGNVVHVNLKFTILSGWSNTASTQICKLPWLPTTSYPWLSRMAGSSTDSSDHYMSSAYIDTTGYICLGEGPYTGLTAGNSIWVYGTYLTNA